MKRGIVVCLSLFLVGPAVHAQAPSRTLTTEAFLSLDRVADPQISPDGAWITYSVTVTDLDANSRSTDLWMVSSAGGEPQRVSERRFGGSGGRWSPDGTLVAYITTRGGPPRVRVYETVRRRSRTLVELQTGAEGIVWSPSGLQLAFASRVFAECADDGCNAEYLASRSAAGSQVRVYDELLYRHWNRWDDGRWSHIFVASLAGGDVIDVLAGREYHAPPPPFGDSKDYTFSADGQSIVFATKTGSDRAWHTNSDLYEVPVAGGEPRLLTSGFRGGERYPAFSPDGTRLAFLSQTRAGFESDRWRLMVRDLATGATSELPRDFLQSVSEFAWLPDTGGIVFAAQHMQRTVMFRVDDGGRVRELSRWGNSTQLSVARDSGTIAFINDAIHRPGQVFTLSPEVGGAPERVTDLNAERLAGVVMHAAEDISWVGADGRTVRGMLVRPPQFRADERYPLLVLIHGGPQGAWLDSFHPRWNAQAFASGGYVTVLLNPRGSTGFGQLFVDQVSRDWGGRAYIDVMAGVEHAARFDFVDSTRIGAAGGSYGGYMVNWINGHSDRFDVFVSHAGIYNLEAFYGSTEELWFPEWEFGASPWDNRTLYEQWSPHRFAQNFRTPTLVVHGALDYRVPDSQGLDLFTALRRQSVPARLVYFPDEGHFISRPQNQKAWWTEIHEWLARYLEPGGAR